MNKLGKNSVAIFLAAALVTGIFALASPSFIDVEASGDQRDKHKDNRHDKSKGSSVNVKFICNNINVDGLNIDVNPDIVSSLAGAQAQEEGNQEVSANSMGNNERNHEFIKQNDGKDFTFICLQNNNGNGNGNGPPNGVGDCDKCFLPINEQGGIIPPGLLTMLNDYLADTPPDSIDNVRELCESIKGLAGTSNEVTEREIRALLNAALPGESNRPVIDNIIECLLEENLITPSSPQ